MLDADKLKSGDVLSETSHYIVESIYGNSVDLRHYESGDSVQIGKDYLRKFVNTADEFNEVVEVTKEDKKDGTLGIRSIWENIHSGQVFTVCFKKQNKAKSDKKFTEEINVLSARFSEEIDKVKSQKKGVADAAKKLILELVKNPILPYEEGEDRILRGYKIQFESRDGRYNCVDMDIQRTEKEAGIRPVNINTIKYLIFNGVKYVVK